MTKSTPEQARNLGVMVSIPQVLIWDPEESIEVVLKAKQEDGCNIIGYTAWSLMDNFEWYDGYKVRFGLYKVDFNNTELPRTMKQSARFIQKLMEKRELPALPFAS
ncbi:hypothetical protein J6590_051202 [Homalodisca vitripennis]|nr:hypothetical protein J6590_051202 [Homalodisca vitripennis]